MYQVKPLNSLYQNNSNDTLTSFNPLINSSFFTIYHILLTYPKFLSKNLSPLIIILDRTFVGPNRYNTTLFEIQYDFATTYQ